MSKKDIKGIKLPAQFRGDRSVQSVSKHNCKAFTVLGSEAGVRIQADSHLELVNLFVLNAKLDVEEIFDQVLFVWRDQIGKLHKHFFDYVARLRNGKKIGFAVKPAFRAESPDFLKKMQEIAWFAESSGFCSEVRILTEHSCDRIEQRNAQLFWAVREPNDDADRRARRVASDLHGTTSLRDLSIQTEAGAEGYRALVRLIVVQHLIPLKHEIITPKTLVQKKEVFQ
ncbi:hypothetical protein [Roseovarius sp. EL26]|uniref:hypothetical protein n=1 Tax=Roseovarius sp. EL26 TaxID=2126672 RepID=UPI000EA232DA|nr:hypothetical protein [Roseovarius sp. EL26]